MLQLAVGTQSVYYIIDKCVGSQNLLVLIYVPGEHLLAEYHFLNGRNTRHRHGKVSARNGRTAARLITVYYFDLIKEAVDMIGQ